jgi:parallel beta-helix repeat protein
VAGAGNVISGNNQGIALSGCAGQVIQGNRIGTTASGTGDLGNATDGIYVGNAGNMIGGTTSAARNIIAGNNGDGIRGGGSGNRIQANRIGVDINGNPLANSKDGVLLIGSSGSMICDNTVAYNGGSGIQIASGTGDCVKTNSTFSNTGIGINLGWDGVTYNDAGDGDGGANALQNFPVITRASLSSTATTVGGTLNGKANTAYRIELFASPTMDASGYGEGRTFIGYVGVTTDGSGNASFSATLPPTGAGYYVAATATGSDGNTSEYSKAFRLPITVSSTNTAAPLVTMPAGVFSSASITRNSADLLA